MNPPRRQTVRVNVSTLFSLIRVNKPGDKRSFGTHRVSECQRSERIFCPRIQTEHTPAPRFKPTRPHKLSQSAPDFQKQTTFSKPMTRAHPEGAAI